MPADRKKNTLQRVKQKATPRFPYWSYNFDKSIMFLQSTSVLCNCSFSKSRDKNKSRAASCLRFPAFRTPLPDQEVDWGTHRAPQVVEHSSMELIYYVSQGAHSFPNVDWTAQNIELSSETRWLQFDKALFCRAAPIHILVAKLDIKMP